MFFLICLLFMFEVLSIDEHSEVEINAFSPNKVSCLPIHANFLSLLLSAFFFVLLAATLLGVLQADSGVTFHSVHVCIQNAKHLNILYFISKKTTFFESVSLKRRHLRSICPQCPQLIRCVIYKCLSHTQGHFT